MKNINILINTIVLIPKLVLGLFLAAIGTVLMIHANIGLFPWGTLNAGLSESTGMSFGIWSQIIGITILIIMSFFKFFPGLGTILDIFFVGYFIDLIESFHVIPNPQGLFQQILISLMGLFILSFGMSLYMSCGLGAGPRDGLMLMIMKLTGKSVTIVKTTIEICVTLLGLLFGGPFGFGTIMLALIGGKVLNLVFKWTKFDASVIKQQNLFEIFQNSETLNI